VRPPSRGVQATMRPPSRGVQARAARWDSLRGSSVKIGTIQRILAWPLRKDDAHKSRGVKACAARWLSTTRLSSTPSSGTFAARVRPQGAFHYEIQDLGGFDSVLMILHEWAHVSEKWSPAELLLQGTFMWRTSAWIFSVCPLAVRTPHDPLHRRAT